MGPKSNYWNLYEKRGDHRDTQGRRLCDNGYRDWSVVITSQRMLAFPQAGRERKDPP
jgi:hypothetical protein